MFKVITMSDSNYFGAGNLFLKTRNKVDADFVLYGPDLTGKQIRILNENNIVYGHVDYEEFKNKMQSLKFDFILDQILLDYEMKYSGFTFVDFDTFFINNWECIFKYDFDFGITVRNDQVKKRVLRAFTNGGVIFAKHESSELIDFARKTILNGRNDKLKKYDDIWKTLENGRPKHKTHYRHVHRWWCDQIFLSAIAYSYFEKNGYHKIGLKPKIFKFQDFKIGLFGCDYYNVVDSKPKITKEKNIYIRHLKSTGRNALGLKKIKERL